MSISSSHSATVSQVLKKLSVSNAGVHSLLVEKSKEEEKKKNKQREKSCSKERKQKRVERKEKYKITKKRKEYDSSVELKEGEAPAKKACLCSACREPSHTICTCTAKGAEEKREKKDTKKD
jgi:hypothetical protein